MIMLMYSLDYALAPMSIFPLPVFEEDADSSNRDSLTLEEQLALIAPPETLVVRFG